MIYVCDLTLFGPYLSDAIGLKEFANETKVLFERNHDSVVTEVLSGCSVTATPIPGDTVGLNLEQLSLRLVQEPSPKRRSCHRLKLQGRFQSTTRLGFNLLWSV